MRRRKLAGDLTSFFGKPAPQRRGRPTALSDAQLHNQRDQLVQTFEVAWGEIGWELRKCKKAGELIRIFHPLAEGYIQTTISVFCRPSTEPGSAATLHKVRAEMYSLVEPVRTADALRCQASEHLRRADWALVQAPKNKRRIVKRERKKCRKEAWKAAMQLRTLSDAKHRLEVRLQELEASFARQELFRFLKSKRYELTPLSLANAAAGLPYVGWRQSMRRCTKASSIVANGLMYQIFKSVRYLATSANKRTENALVTNFREGIPLLPSRYRLPRTELAEKWLYLDRAIRQSYRTKPHPKALPFEITKRYFKQIQSQSPVDMVLAKQAKLNLSNNAPVSSPQNKP
jgi:hypothetical protein